MSKDQTSVLEGRRTLVIGARADNYVAKALLLEEAVAPSYLRATIWLSVSPSSPACTGFQ